MIELAGEESQEEEDIVMGRLLALKKWQGRAKRLIPVVKGVMGVTKLKD